MVANCAVYEMAKWVCNVVANWAMDELAKWPLLLVLLLRPKYKYFYQMKTTIIITMPPTLRPAPITEQ